MQVGDILKNLKKHGKIENRYRLQKPIGIPTQHLRPKYRYALLYMYRIMRNALYSSGMPNEPVHFSTLSINIPIVFELLGQLSGVLRAAARLILLLPRSESVTDRIRTELHWLDIPSRVTFKLCVLAYRCIHGSAPSYLARFFTPVSAIAGRSQLRSAAAGALLVPRSHTLTIGPRAFAIFSPSAWNSLPVDLRDPSLSLLSFRKKLKTYLFNVSVN